MTQEPARHWDALYGAREPTRHSWHQDRPATSMRLVARFATPRDPVVDVGAGTSSLADALLRSGWSDVTVLDVSDEALAAVRERLGDRVRYVTADVLTWRPARAYDVWHDRAVFHFLVDETAQALYAELAARTVPSGGLLIVGTFAADGPTSCSGLPTAGYDADGLAARFAAGFAPEHAEREGHVTPSGTVQPFTWVVLRRR